MNWRSAFWVAGRGNSRTCRRFSGVNEVPSLDMRWPTYSTSSSPSSVFSGLAVMWQHMRDIHRWSSCSWSYRRWATWQPSQDISASPHKQCYCGTAKRVYARQCLSIKQVNIQWTGIWTRVFKYGEQTKYIVRTVYSKCVVWTVYGYVQWDSAVCTVCNGLQCNGL